ncbi:MAG: acyl carrier protein [Bacteroidales bacterium]
METINDFITKFKSQYIDADSFDLEPESEFRKLGTWDSLTAMAILVMIKDEYNVDITVEKFRELHTIKDVYDYINTQTTK